MHGSSYTMGIFVRTSRGPLQVMVLHAMMQWFALFRCVWRSKQHSRSAVTCHMIMNADPTLGGTVPYSFPVEQFFTFSSILYYRSIDSETRRSRWSLFAERSDATPYKIAQAPPSPLAPPGPSAIPSRA